MLRPPCDTARVDDLIARLTAAAAAFGRLRDGVAAGEPWPLSPAYGAEPESDWGPKEILAHVAEMLPYWTAEIERILAAGPAPVPFGRVVTDAGRIARIGADRRLPSGELFDRVAADAAAAAGRWRSLAPADAARLGEHVRLGPMAVESIAERFVVDHLEEHVRQLGGILAARSDG